MKLDHKHQMGDLVFHKGAAYWVTGIVAHIGYGSLNWEYQLTKPAYDIAQPENLRWLGSKMDVNNVSVKEYDIKTFDEYKAQRIAELDKLLQSAQKELRALESERTHLAEAQTIVA